MVFRLKIGWKTKSYKEISFKNLKKVLENVYNSLKCVLELKIVLGNSYISLKNN